jgi:hypothetical protein
MEAIRSSEKLVTTYKSKWRHNPEDHNRQSIIYFMLRSKKFGYCKMTLSITTLHFENEHKIATLNVYFIIFTAVNL